MIFKYILRQPNHGFLFLWEYSIHMYSRPTTYLVSKYGHSLVTGRGSTFTGVGTFKRCELAILNDLKKKFEHDYL